jgi:Uma2 family endonuclease
MAAAATATLLPLVASAYDAPGGRVHVSGVTWEQYQALRLACDERPSVRLTYRERELDILVPSEKHELIKKMLARLLETYAVECGADLNGYGSTTFFNRAKARGLEPDECYVLGTTLVEVPDLAIEVALTSGGIDKLDVYAGLAIPEVWIWRDDALEVWCLSASGTGYDRCARSMLLPKLDLDLLLRFVALPNQSAAVRAYRDALRASPQ